MPAMNCSSPRRRYLLALLGISLWLAACAWLTWTVYKGVRGGTARQMAALQSTLAAQAARSISDHLEGIQNDLQMLAQDDGVIDTTAFGSCGATSKPAGASSSP
jgi:hypothetical protein